MLDERSRVGVTGEGQSMAGSGQASSELDARVDDAGQTARYREDASHSGSTVTDWEMSTRWILLALQVSILSRHSIPWLPRTSEPKNKEAWMSDTTAPHHGIE